MDQKDELNRLDGLHKKAKTQDRRMEIKEQQEYIFNQGLQALRRHERELPHCVRAYYLGSREKPSMDEISSELQKINYSDYKSDKRVIKGVVIATIIVLTVIALFF